MTSIRKHFIIIHIIAILVNYDNAIAQQVKPVRVDAKDLKHISITGFAHGFKDRTILYLDDVEKLGTAIDSAVIINERFIMRLQKITNESPKEYAIRTKSYSDYKIFWVENISIIFIAIKSNFREAIINGSVFQQQAEAFERLTIPLVKEIESLRRNFGTIDSVVYKKILAFELELQMKSVDFVEANAAFLISAYLLNDYCKEWGRRTAKDLYQKLSSANSQSDYGQTVKKFVDLNKEQVVGSSYFDFQQPSADGSPILLSSLSGKYILLEFWTSWCGPCRKENPNMVALYEKYKNRGFEIFGVSLDVSAAAWKKAIKDDILRGQM